MVPMCCWHSGLFFFRMRRTGLRWRDLSCPTKKARRLCRWWPQTVPRTTSTFDLGVILEHVPRLQTLAVLTMSLWRSWELRFIAVLSCVCITPFVPPIRSGSFVPGRHSRIGAPRGNRHTRPSEEKKNPFYLVQLSPHSHGEKKSCYLTELSP